MLDPFPVSVFTPTFVTMLHCSSHAQERVLQKSQHTAWDLFLLHQSQWWDIHTLCLSPFWFIWFIWNPCLSPDIEDPNGRVWVAFRRLDSDGDGYLNIDDFVGLGWPMVDNDVDTDQMERLFHHCDRTGDGRVSHQVLYKQRHKNFKERLIKYFPSGV